MRPVQQHRPLLWGSAFARAQEGQLQSASSKSLRCGTVSVQYPVLARWPIVSKDCTVIRYLGGTPTVRKARQKRT